MKFALMALVLVTTVGAQAVRADEMGDLSDVLLSPTIITFGLGAGCKEAYVAQIRDDAAEQIAEGGAPSALLADAIKQIREETGTTASDAAIILEISKS